MSRNYDTPIVAVDLDNTIAQYDGWVSIDHFERPIDGAAAAMQELKEEGWEIMVYTCRSNPALVEKYLRKWHIPYDTVNAEIAFPSEPVNGRKLFANIYCDDRAVEFTGDWREVLKRIKKKYKEEELCRL